MRADGRPRGPGRRRRGRRRRCRRRPATAVRTAAPAPAATVALTAVRRRRRRRRRGVSPAPRVRPTAARDRPDRIEPGDAGERGALALRRLHRPIVFAAEHWGRAPAAEPRGRAGRGGFTDLLDARAVDELVSERGLRTPFLRMAKDGKVLPGRAVHPRRRRRRRDRRPGRRRQGAGRDRRRRHARAAGTAPHLAAARRLRRAAGRRARPPGPDQRLHHPAAEPGLRAALRRPRRLRAAGGRPQALDDPRARGRRPAATTSRGTASSADGRRPRRRGAADRHGARAGRRALPAARHDPRGRRRWARPPSTSPSASTRSRATTWCGSCCEAAQDDPELRASLPMGVDLADPAVLAAAPGRHRRRAAPSARRRRPAPESPRPSAPTSCAAPGPSRSARSPSWPRPTALDADTPLRLRAGLRVRRRAPPTSGCASSCSTAPSSLPADAGDAVKVALGRRRRSPRASCPGLDADEQLTLARRLLREGVLVRLRVSPPSDSAPARARRWNAAPCAPSCAATRCWAPPSRPPALLLVEQPGPWGAPGCASRASTRRRPPRSSGGPARAGMRVQAIRRPGRTPRACDPRRWALVDTRDGRETLRWGTFDARRRAARRCRWTARAGASPTPTRSTWSAPTASTTPAARCAAVRSPRRSPSCARTGSGSAATSAATASPRTSSCCPAACSTAGCCRSRRRSSSPPPRPARWSARCCAAGSGCRRSRRPPSRFAYEHLALRAPHATCAVDRRPARRSDGTATVVRLAAPHGALDVTVRVERVAADGLTCAQPRPGHVPALPAGQRSTPVEAVTVGRRGWSGARA